jgi:hypothetical protein
MNHPGLFVLPIILLLIAVEQPSARAEDLPPKYRAMTDKALQWLVQQQHKDGHWETPGGQFATAMTGLAGMALLMQGSTMRDGKYARNIREAVEYLLEHTQRSGLIGEVNAPNQGLGYLHGHGYALLFLAQVYGEEDDAEHRLKLQDLLTRAVQFTCKAQTSRGGWGYISALDGNDWDEGSVSVTQVQALRAARNAGIAVPREAIDKVHKYLTKGTTSDGGVIYSLASDNSYGGQARPSITVAAIASMFSAGEYNSPLPRRWLKFVQPVVPLESVGSDQFGHSEYTHYYYAQVIYMLGEDGYEKMFPESAPADRLTWSRYKKAFFDYLARSQQKDGNWVGTPIGPVYTTSCYLAILQLDKGALPIYQR